jgi:hypothetical protein
LPNHPIITAAATEPTITTPTRYTEVAAGTTKCIGDHCHPVQPSSGHSGDASGVEPASGVFWATSNSAPGHCAAAESFLRSGLFSSATGDLSGVAVARVARLEPLLSKLVTDFLWDLARDWVRPGLKFGSLGSRKRSGFCPENAQIECACGKSDLTGVTFPVLPRLPVASPANAAVALAPVKTAAQSMAARNDFVPDLGLDDLQRGCDRADAQSR